MPPIPEVESMMDALRGESDMTVAIMAGSFLELELERLISSRLRSKDPNLLGQLFLNRGPLSDFHSKILVAQAMGFITGPMANELHSLKAIRNAFAHARAPLRFDNDLVSKEIESLKMIIAMKNAKEGMPLREWDNKTWYLVVTRILLIMLDSTRKHGGTANDAIANALLLDEQKRRPTSP